MNRVWRGDIRGIGSSWRNWAARRWNSNAHVRQPADGGPKLEELRLLPMCIRPPLKSEKKGGPYKYLNLRGAGLDLDHGYKDLYRLAHLSATLHDHVEFLREEGDEKLDEIRYARIRLALKKSNRVVSNLCDKIGIDREILLGEKVMRIEIPPDIMDYNKIMDIYDLHDELREYMFQMDLLEPRTTCISDAHKFLRRIPSQLEEKSAVDSEDISLDLGEDVLEANKKAMLESLSLEKKFKGFHSALIHVKRTGHMSTGGQVRTYRVVVGVGNMKGTGGVGFATAKTIPEACRQACAAAFKRLVTVELADGRTLPYNISNRTPRFSLWPANKGFGLKIARPLQPIMTLMGFKDLSGKIHVKNPNTQSLNVMVMHLLRDLRTPEQIAHDRGKTLTDIDKWHQTNLREADRIRSIMELESATKQVEKK